MSEKSLDKVLEFFEEGPSEPHDAYVVYDIEEGHVAYWEHEEVDYIMVSHDKTKFQIHTTERGMLEATESAIANLNVYELKQVY